MAEFETGTGEQAAFRDELVGHGLLIETGVPGVFGRSSAFEDVLTSVDAMVTRVAAGDHSESVRFPPLLPRHQLESSGYLRSFPQLAGTIFAFRGTEADATSQQELAARHEDWSGYQSMTDLVLLPAACYPVYPAIAKRGPLPSGGLTIDAGAAYVFRHEPSADPARLQMFHQREMVRLGAPDTVEMWRDTWRDRAVTLLRHIGLDAELDVATDPFFGRSGRMLAANQRVQQLKFEVRIPIAGPEPTAVASFNYHQDHFTHSFGITMADGGVAHTACLGFGLERITLGLFRTHGIDVTTWPADVMSALRP